MSIHAREDTQVETAKHISILWKQNPWYAFENIMTHLQK